MPRRELLTPARREQLLAFPTDRIRPPPLGAPRVHRLGRGPPLLRTVHAGATEERVALGRRLGAGQPAVQRLRTLPITEAGFRIAAPF
jgi:hypothetical protein